MITQQQTTTRRKRTYNSICFAGGLDGRTEGNENEKFNVQKFSSSASLDEDDEEEFEISDELWEDIEGSQPPVWMVMKQVR